MRLMEILNSGTSLEVLHVRVRDIYAFARATARSVGPSGLVPISPQRALAHANNPYSEPEDVALLVASVEGRYVGYMGLLPGRAIVGDGVLRVNYMTTWYVSPEVRGGGVGHQLLNAAVALPLDLIITVFTESAGRVMRAAGFREFGPLSYYSLDITRAAPWTRIVRALPRSFPGMAHIETLERTATRSVKRLAYRILQSRYRSALDAVRWEEVTEIRESLYRDEPSSPGGAKFIRGPQVVNWMLKYPWVLDSSDPEAVGMVDYYFSNVKEVFRQTALKVYRRQTGEYMGFVLYSASTVGEGIIIRVFDHAVVQPENRHFLLAVLLHQAASWDADAIVLSDKFGRALDQGSLGMLISTKRRPYLAHLRDKEGELATVLDQIELEYCDSDTAFT